MSSASKFILYGIGATLFRAPRTRSANPPLLFAKPSPLKPLRFHRCISSSAAVDTVTAENTNYAETLSCVDQPHPHPWPEWVSFVDRLKTKGYLVESSASSSVEGGDGFDVSSGGVGVTTNDSVYRNMNLVKDACLSFARDRYDIFKSLSEDNIQAVVKSGCPNLLRKAVNSAKSLRRHSIAYYLDKLPSVQACSTCNLRGSCDRAYVILKVPEANARTVDIMRILMNYALDPLVISGGEKPPGRDVIESSTRKLLSELIELSESSTAPAPPPPPPKATTKYAPPGDQSLNLMTDKVSKNVDMRFGDWMCPK
ncbi:zinc finger protein VAR3, chloroplastic [Senna tora]|uniref:Zinc finger protein VAR3, chloroplastic n=1 Tax=Senna tora TaxID=362788 RepID=A0A834TJH0_9FABA|nr:zinc finger protein VAR3, chloroplastic [Senna tora]